MNLLQRYNILHRLQVHHLTLTFIIHNKYAVEHKMLAQLKLNEKYWFNEMQTG